MNHVPREDITRLTQIPNIGKAIAADLRLLGIERPDQLIGEDPFMLYRDLSRVTGKPCDPCVIDVFMAAVHFMDGGAARPWWTFTDERKQMLSRRDTDRE